MKTQTKLLPLLKWAGSKYRSVIPGLISRYYAAYPNSIYVSRFGGALGDTLGIMPNKAIIADVNPILIGFYNWIKNTPEVFPLEINNTSFTYYSYRERFNYLKIEYQLRLTPGMRPMPQDQKDELFTLFLWLNKACFNGIYRESKGRFNVPKGDTEVISFPDFLPYVKAFQNWEFVCSDFDDLDLPEECFIYDDPPYYRTYSDYVSKGFSSKDHYRLALSGLDHPRIISNSYHHEMVQTYQKLGFEIFPLEINRSLNPSAERKAMEIFAVKL